MKKKKNEPVKTGKGYQKSYKYLSPGEVEIIERRKAILGERKEKKDLELARKMTSREDSRYYQEVKPKAQKVIKTLDTFTKKEVRTRLPKTIVQPQKIISKEQGVLRELFGGSPSLWGTGNNLPKLNNSLNSGGGLIKNGDFNRETGRLFGLR